MRIAIATDAWLPQVNGVVNTLIQTRDALIAQGHEVLMITPEGRRTFPCPTYPEIRLALFQGRGIARELDAFRPNCIHVATEGTIGYSVRRYCRKRELPFTTAYHTQFPEYVRARFPIPVAWTYAMLRWFHRPAHRTLVATPAMQQLLQDRGFEHVVIWSRGVDTDVFSPDTRVDFDLPRPIWVNVGRVAVEKNIEKFLNLDLPGSKIVIGDGPDLKRLKNRYPDCHFLGYKFGKDLARHIAGADVFVFPSITDTFGLVMLEAMACGIPVAAMPVTGPIDVVTDGSTGVLDDDLARACHAAANLSAGPCRQFALDNSWSRSTEQFVRHLAPVLEPAHCR
ncbi:MAG: glycosyltransferase family 1 protein [Gammaproteobacteria bacterium]|nr:glycosyltransferase family 1 protein [Gammaproteobacteria bacterium]